MTEVWPIGMRDDIERIECRRCGAHIGACFKPQDAAAIVSIQFEGQSARTEFHFERVYDYVFTVSREKGLT